MKNLTSTFFETTIRYDKMMDNGMLKAVSELYAVDALSFTEAEAAIMQEMAPYISGDFTVQKIQRAPYHEYIFNDEKDGEKFYRLTAEYITIDEKTDREKRQKVHSLICADTIEQARAYYVQMMTAITEYNIVTITETKILDTFLHAEKVAPAE